MSYIICLMGPTAVGKTDLAIKLSSYFPLELISVDSAMVYRGMDIGTAKPSKENPHYLIDICDPNENYSVGKFCEDALTAIKRIESNHHIPLLVGGTMMYFRALQQGLSDLPKTNESIRKKISGELEKVGPEKLHEKLLHVDPITANKIHPRDSQRISRALEVFESTGIPLSIYHEKKTSSLKDYQIINIGIVPKERDKLKARIKQRFMMMLDNGFIEEVKKLLVYKDCPSMKSVGYYEVGQYLQHQLDKDTLIEKAVVATCQLAKRQMTWLRSFENMTFFESDSAALLEEVVKYIGSQLVKN
jgi:tRNA dimethylallyltransferase